MINVMLDLETMGVTANAPVTSVAAVVFDPATGSTGARFSQNIALDDEIRAGAVIDASTIKFWTSQDSEVAQRVLFTDPQPAVDVLHDFAKWLHCWGGADVRVWGNGASFDCGILKTCYTRHGLVAPWMFWAECDVRTLVALDRDCGRDTRSEIPFSGDQHDPIDDCLHQIKYVSSIYQQLVKP